MGQYLLLVATVVAAAAVGGTAQQQKCVNINWKPLAEAGKDYGGGRWGALQSQK